MKIYFLWKSFSLSFPPNLLKKYRQKHAKISIQFFSVRLTFEFLASAIIHLSEVVF